MKKVIVFLMVLSVMSMATVAFAEESLKNYDGGAIFHQDVQDDRLLDG